MPGVYIGEDLHAIDPKGRLNLPARLRRVAAKHGGLSLWIMPGFEECLVILDEEGYLAYSERIRNLPMSARDARLFERKLYPRIAELEPDAQGRIVIPENLRRLAGLEGEVLIRGTNDRIELWNPARWAAYEVAHDQSMAEIAQNLVF